MSVQIFFAPGLKLSGSATNDININLQKPKKNREEKTKMATVVMIPMSCRFFKQYENIENVS